MARKNDPMYEKRKKLAVTAFEKGCILFASDTQKWYTPREFIESDEIIKSEIYALQEYTNIVMHYPKSAIGWHTEKVHQAQENFDSFLARVLEAFDLHPISKEKRK